MHTLKPLSGQPMKHSGGPSLIQFLALNQRHHTSVAEAAQTHSLLICLASTPACCYCCCSPILRALQGDEVCLDRGCRWHEGRSARVWVLLPVLSFSLSRPHAPLRTLLEILSWS